MNEHNLGADGFLQLSLQIAHNELHGWPCATYESASTCAYQSGRTETIRPCTVESRELCQIYSQADFDNSNTQKRIDASLRSAIKGIGSVDFGHFQFFEESDLNQMKAHNKGMMHCLQGQGFDRHLFGLRNEATKAGLEMPKFVQDQTFQTMNHFRMSTSTLNSPYVESGGFGPVVEDGYALGYMVFNDFIGVVAVSKPKNGVDSVAFAAKLKEVWKNLSKCVTGAK